MNCIFSVQEFVIKSHKVVRYRLVHDLFLKDTCSLSYILFINLRVEECELSLELLDDERISNQSGMQLKQKIHFKMRSL